MDAFTLFPNLPKELRLKIWEHAIHSIPPRMVDVYTICFQDPDEDLDESPDIDASGNLILDLGCWEHLHQFIPLQPPLTHLQICAEARAVASQHHQLGMPQIPMTRGLSLAHAPRTCEHTKAVAAQKRNFYFNPERDVLHFHHYTDALVQAGPGPYTYVCTPQNTSSLWILDHHVLQAPRFVSVEFNLLLTWFEDSKRLPDLSRTEVLGVLIRRGRDGSYPWFRWRGKTIVDGTDCHFEKGALEKTVSEILVHLEKGKTIRKEGLIVRVHKSKERILEEVTALR